MYKIQDNTQDANQWKLFINGELYEEITAEIPIIGDGGDIVINRHTWDSGQSSRLSGMIDEVRFSDIARYSENFTPSTAQLQNDENTLLLLNFEDSSNSQVIDSSNYQNHGNVIGQVNYQEATFSSASNILWSTGETTESISVSPTETTEYWVDVTTNGVTNRDTITITVNTTDAPTGDAQQSFDTAATVADLSATGDNLQWYDAATGGNLLDSNAALTNGQVVYASQTVDGCESTERLEVTVVISTVEITASASEVCEGDSVDLIASTNEVSIPAYIPSNELLSLIHI